MLSHNVNGSVATEDSDLSRIIVALSCRDASSPQIAVAQSVAGAPVPEATPGATGPTGAAIAASSTFPATASVMPDSVALSAKPVCVFPPFPSAP